MRESQTAGDIIIASKRIRLWWFNTGWMLIALLLAHERFESPADPSPALRRSSRVRGGG